MRLGNQKIAARLKREEVAFRGLLDFREKQVLRFAGLTVSSKASERGSLSLLFFSESSALNRE